MTNEREKRLKFNERYEEAVAKYGDEGKKNPIFPNLGLKSMDTWNKYYINQLYLESLGYLFGGKSDD